jgi:anaerobic magnesium-protoporphyrin IX monomethyl ester cyclase
MDILLINPPSTHAVKSGISKFIDSFSSSSPMPPLGLMYLAAFLEQNKYSVKICDMNIGESLSPHLIWDDRPRFVGITATTLNFYDVLQVAKSIKDLDKNIKVIVGGSHCSIYPDETLDFPQIDYVVKGEGELLVLEILNGASRGVYGPRQVDDVDSLPMPARHLLKGNYGTALARKKSASLVSSRNCPMRCSFCYQPGGHWRARTANSVVAEMQQLAEEGIGEIEIYDDTFTLNRQRVVDICSLILRSKIKIDWNIRTRVDRVDDELLDLMKIAGCKRINYGIESINQRILDILGKGFSVSQITEAVRATKKCGIEIQAYFMLGSPDETFDEMWQTVEFAKKMKPDYAYFSITSPMPGTDMYQQGLKDNRYPDYWRTFVQFPYPDAKMRIWDQQYREQIIKVVENAYKSFYFNPAYILKQQLKVRSWKEFKGKAKMALKMLK